MKYTKEQLQAMSDFEVNKVLSYSAGMDGVWRDYCHTPNDIMPLAFEHRISLIENDAGYTAYHNFSVFEDINYRIEHGAYFGHENPLRAIACCLILVLQGEKE